MKNYLFAPFLFSPLSPPSSEGKFKMCKNFLFITPVKNKFKIWQILPVVCWWKGAKITQGENNSVYSISMVFVTCTCTWRLSSFISCMLTFFRSEVKVQWSGIAEHEMSQVWFPGFLSPAVSEPHSHPPRGNPEVQVLQLCLFWFREPLGSLQGK